MIDFVKFELLNPNLELLETNEYLEFHADVNTVTGEISRLKKAFYKGMKFTIITTINENQSSKVTVEGSLHKYWNGGSHNFNDFGVENIFEVLEELKQKFSIEPENCILRQVEMGVNIDPYFPTKDILECCLMHKRTPFKSIYVKDEGEYIQARHQEYIVKIYNKRKHYTQRGYEIPNEIMRFEIKHVKMRYWHQLGVYSLEDLTQREILKAYGLELIKQWKHVLFYDFEVLLDTERDSKYSNIYFWLSLSNGQFKYHRRRLNNKRFCKGDNLKAYIRNWILDKYNNLCSPRSKLPVLI